MSLLNKASIVTTPTAYENGKILSVKPSIVLGEELVTNGDFATDSDWSKGTGWSIANGKALYDGLNGTQQIFSSTGNISIVGKTYKITFNVLTQGGGNNTASFGGVVFSNTNFSVDSYEFYVTAVSTGRFGIFGRNGDVFSIDNVSVKEVLDADFDFTRNSSATRVNSQGLIEDMQILSGDLVSNGDFSQEGSEEVTNGDFATDTNWSKGTGWSISGGKANANTTGNFINLYQNSVFIVGKTYKTTFTITDYTQGSIRLTQNGYDVSGFQNAVGTYTAYFTASQTGLYMQGYESFIGSIDNVSVKEVGQNWALSDGATLTDNGVRIVSDGTYQNALQNNILTVGKQYKVQYEIVENNSGTLKIQTTLGISPIPTTVGVHTVNGVAAQTYLSIERSGVCDITIDNISVIEITEDTNLPRIDYTGGEGHWLFEPQSTNLITYSEDFANAAWSKIGNTAVTSNTVISPNGTLDGSTVSGLSGTGSNDLRFVKSENTANNTYTYSVYLKGSGTVRIQLSNGVDQGFDDTITLTSSWKRHFLTSTFNSTTSTSLTATLDDFYGQTATQFDIWGAQLEQNSYATSYIPTNGEVNGVTRLADAAFGAGNSDLINSTEGTLYAEIAALADDNIARNISLGNGSSIANTVEIFYNTGSQSIHFRVRANNSVVGSVSGGNVTDRTQFAKVAIKYKSGEIKGFINGLQVLSITDSFTFSDSLSQLTFDRGSGTDKFEGKTKCVAVFKEALTDAELTCLTTI